MQFVNNILSWMLNLFELNLLTYIESLLEYFTGYLSILALKSFNNNIEFGGEITGDIRKLGSHLVSINLFESNGNLVKYNDKSLLVKIILKLQVNIKLFLLFQK